MSFPRSHKITKRQTIENRNYKTVTKDSGDFGKYNGSVDHQIIITGETTNDKLVGHTLSSFRESKKTCIETQQQMQKITNKNWHLSENGKTEPYSLTAIAIEYNEKGYAQLSANSRISAIPVLLEKEDIIKTPQHKLYSDFIYEELSVEAKKSYEKTESGDYITLAFNPSSENYHKVLVHPKQISDYKDKNNKTTITEVIRNESNDNWEL